MVKNYLKKVLSIFTFCILFAIPCNAGGLRVYFEINYHQIGLTNEKVEIALVKIDSLGKQVVYPTIRNNSFIFPNCFLDKKVIVIAIYKGMYVALGDIKAWEDPKKDTTLLHWKIDYLTYNQYLKMENTTKEQDQKKCDRQAKIKYVTLLDSEYDGYDGVGEKITIDNQRKFFRDVKRLLRSCTTINN